jgi:hypothetical protein
MDVLGGGLLGAVGAHVVQKFIDAVAYNCGGCGEKKHGLNTVFSCCDQHQCSSCAGRTKSTKVCSACGKKINLK